MTAIILSIGDELVLGQTIDTNSAWLSQQLAAVGVPVIAHCTIADDQAAIEQAIRDSARRCDLLIISGGIGPTEDDLTRQALASVMKVPLELNHQWLTRLEQFFKKVNRSMPALNKIQAMIPRGAQMIENTAGTAAGIHALLPLPLRERAGERGEIVKHHDASVCRIYVTPGVPKEMKIMFANSILPELHQQAGRGVILSKTLHTFGLGESSIAEKLGPLMNRARNPSVGTTVANGIVSLRINARFADHAEAQRQLDATTAACALALGELIFAYDDQTFPQSVADLLRKDPVALRWAPALATAESCTGGLLAKMLTDIPGSSEFFRQGYITYSNESKTDLLNVPPELVAQHGAVSEPVAHAMAQGVQRQAGTAYALSITGIAGPTGGTPEKPVGTVCIVLAAPSSPSDSAPRQGEGSPSSPLSPRERLGEGAFDHATPPVSIFSRTFHFTGDREMIRDRAAKMALTILRFHLLAKPLPF